MLDKFYSDIIKASKKIDFADNITYIFCKEIKKYDASLLDLAEDLVVYWKTEYGESNKQTPQETADWFFNLFSFLTDNFEPDMDFSDKDWEEIRFSLNAVEEDIDLDLLNSFMSILLERKKI